jgi:Rap1a immunity proteins
MREGTTMRTLAAALLVCSTAAHANTSGNELFKACRNFVYEVKDDDVFNRGVCYGIIEGAATVAGLHGAFCCPKGVTFGQIAMIVVNYMTQHPEIMHHDLASIAETALMQAWPCKK